MICICQKTVSYELIPLKHKPNQSKAKPDSEIASSVKENSFFWHWFFSVSYELRVIGFWQLTWSTTMREMKVQDMTAPLFWIPNMKKNVTSKELVCAVIVILMIYFQWKKEMHMYPSSALLLLLLCWKTSRNEQLVYESYQDIVMIRI